VNGPHPGARPDPEPGPHAGPGPGPGPGPRQDLRPPAGGEPAGAADEREPARIPVGHPDWINAPASPATEALLAWVTWRLAEPGAFA
jgi:hypothetical protein